MTYVKVVVTFSVGKLRKNSQIETSVFGLRVRDYPFSK